MANVGLHAVRELADAPTVIPSVARNLALIVCSVPHFCLTSKLCFFIFIMNTFEEA